MKCKATDKDDATVDPVFGKVGKQTIENTGPLTKKRMETVDEEFIARSARFHGPQDQGRRAVVLLLQPDAHARLHPSEAVLGGRDRPRPLSGRHGRTRRLCRPASQEARRSRRRRQHHRRLHHRQRRRGMLSWPDGGATPFRGEKDTNWEGGWRVPCVMRWPGVIEPGRVINDICSLQDFIPTFAAAAGEPDLVAKVKKGYKIGEHDLQGPPRRLQPPALPVRQGEGIAAQGLPLLERRRRPDGAARQPVQDRLRGAAASGLDVWREPLTQMRIPKMFDLRSDPFERGEDSFNYNDWFVEHVPYQYAAQAVVARVA